MTAETTAAPTPPAPAAPRIRAAWITTLIQLGRSVLRGFRIVGRLIADYLGRFWAIAGPVLGIVSPLGWIVLLAAAASVITGLVLGWPEFSYLGLTLIGALLIASLFLLGRASYRVGIELTPPRVTVGERALGRLLIASTAAKRSVASRMELPVGRGVAEFQIPALSPQQEHEELFAVPTNRRAVIIAGPAISIRGDQLGLLRRTVKWTEPKELFVHPRTVRLNPSATGLVKDLEGETTKTITEQDISFHALRPYQPGDALKNVHWRTSARTGTLMVRQFEETRRSQLLAVLSTDMRHYLDDPEFELAVSSLASIAVQIIRDGTTLDVISEGHRLHTATPLALLDDSCRLELSLTSRYPSLRDFVRDASKRLANPSVVLIVTGSKTDIHELRAVTTIFGNDTRLLAIRIERDAPAKISNIGGITVATVSDLGEVPRMMKRVSP